MKAEDIRDEETLRQWLEERPEETRQRDAVMIAQRCACRVLPFVGRIRSAKGDLTELPSLRASLTSGVAALGPTPEVRDAAAAAAADEAAAYASVYATAYAARASARAASAAAASAEAAAAAASYAAARAAAYASAGTAYIWEPVRDDARTIESGKSPITLRLWSIPHPDWFRQIDGEMRVAWAQDVPGIWDFWLRWWDGVLSGQQINWDLQREVALIPDDIWQAGPRAVAEAIREIEGRFARQKDEVLERAIRDKPFALSIDVDATSASLVANEIRQFELEDIIAAIEQAIKDFTRRTGQMMGLNEPGGALREAVNPAIRELRRDLKQYCASPLRLHDAISDAISEILFGARRGGVQGEPLLQRLVASWARQQTDLCGTSPELLETVQRRTMVAVTMFTDAELRQAVSQGQALHDLSSGYLRVASAWALSTIQNRTASTKEKQSAWYFLAAVLPRGAQSALRYGESHKASQKGSIAEGVKNSADIAVAADKIVDVAQENLPELADFGHRIVSEITSGNWFGLGTGLGG